MKSLGRSAACACLLLLLPGPGAGADDKKDTPTFMDSAAWARLDPEVRWVKFLARENGADRDTWLQWLAGQGDDALLEWLVLSEGWHPGGKLLYERRSPRWVRCALWALAAVSSHGFENATTQALRKEPALALAYLEKYPALQKEAGVKVLLAGLRKAQVTPGDVGDQLPPLDPDLVYAALDAAPSVGVLRPDGTADFGERGGKPETGPAYVHQVERAIRTLQRSNRRTQKALASLRRLIEHPRESIARHACLAYTHMPAELLPFDRLLQRIDDPDESVGVREAALMAYSKASHPEVTARLVEIAVHPTHPAWQVAIARLVDRRDPFVLRLDAIGAAADREPEARTFLAREEKRLQGALRKRKAKQWGIAVPVLLEQSAWLRLSGHKLAEPYAAAVREALLDQRDARPVHDKLTRLSQAYAPKPVLFEGHPYRDTGKAGPTVAALQAAVRASAQDIIEHGR